MQGFDEARGSREEHAGADQKPRPIGEAHPSDGKREDMSDSEHGRKLERRPEIDLQCSRGWHEPFVRRAETRLYMPMGEVKPGQTRLKISVPLVPPNPKEFESAVRIGMRRAVFGT